uniref:Uncharacterized protein n=1 Tax=viral metagenome TaxID=1070528 RepID=A0A6C0KM90_9ZZZZ
MEPKIAQSLHTIITSSRHSTINNNNEGKKHDSYSRYLNKKKGEIFNKDCKCKK